MPRKPTAKKNKTAKAPEVDLRRVTEIAQAGVWQAGPIADILGLPRSALLNSQVKDAVNEAIQQGKSKHFFAALQAYDKAVESRNGNLTGLCIFKLKQHGWQDRPNLDLGEMSPLELQGATDRFYSLLERHMRKVDAEGAA